MEDRRDKELDNFFRNRLNNSDDEKSQWNLPSDDIFDSAMDRVHDKKRKDRTPLLWIIGLLILGSLSWTMFTMNQNTIQLEKALTEINTEILKKEIEIQKLRMELAELKKLNSHTEKTIPAFALNKSVKQDHTESITGQIDIDKKQDYNEGNKSTIRKVDFITKERQTSLYTSSQIMKSLEQIEPIHSTIKSKIIIQPRSVLNSIPILSNAQANSQMGSGNKWRFFIEGRKHFISLEMNGIENTSMDLTAYDQRYPGYSFSIGATHPISKKWRLQYKLGYLSFANESVFKDQLKYDENYETVDRFGNSFYNTSLNISSPINEFQSQVIVPVNTIPIQNEDNYNNITNITDNYNFFTLSGLSSFNIFDTDKWQLNISAGIQINYLLVAKEDMDVKLYYNTQMMKNEVFKRVASDDINPLSLSALGDIQVNFKLSNSAHIGLSGALGRSITPINVPKKGSIPRTYIEDLSIGLNSCFKF